MAEDPDIVWANKMDELGRSGFEMVKRAATEALEYMNLVIENLDDDEYRRIAVDTQMVEMGVGDGLMDIVYPIAEDMRKKLHKEFKHTNNPKNTAKMLRGIFLARTVKNIMKELNSGDK